MNVSITRETTIVIGDQTIELTDEQLDELRAKLGVQPPVVYVSYQVYPAIQPAIVPINPLPWTPHYVC